AFLRVKLKYLNSALEKRRQNAQKLLEQLREKWSAVMPVDSCVCQGDGGARDVKTGTVLLPFSCHSTEGEHTWNQFVIRVAGPENRNVLKEKLASVGIQTEVYYPRAMHEQGCFNQVEGRYPISEKLCMETMALPLSGSFSLPLIK
ncbi:MAG: hypothetical protein EBU96_12115, partial [Actinobacteria bacterium]|nr:hypothetical protein [Actinomycetota bacterium]